MAYLSKYGTIWGEIPATAGRVFWVAPGDSYTVDGRSYSASDNNDGLSPERALRRINRAWALVSANVGDVIALLPGTHTPADSAGTATSVAANVAGVTMVGLHTGQPHPIRPRATIAAVTGDETINVTAANIKFGYFGIIPVTQKAAIDLSAAANQFHAYHLYVDLNTPAAHTSTKGIVALGAATQVCIEYCIFDSDGAQGPAIDLTATTSALVQHNIFQNTAGTWATAVLCGAATGSCLIRRNQFHCYGTAMTVGIDGTGATLASGVQITDNRAGSLVTKLVDNFDAGEAEISENYDAGVGAADGGVLITAIT